MTRPVGRSSQASRFKPQADQHAVHGRAGQPQHGGDAGRAELAGLSQPGDGLLDLGRCPPWMGVRGRWPVDQAGLAQFPPPRPPAVRRRARDAHFRSDVRGRTPRGDAADQDHLPAGVKRALA